MKEQNKTKKQLLNELAKLHQRITELEKLEIECKRMEETLRESEEKYRNIFENASDAIFTIDVLSRFTNLNKKAEEISGYKREELLRKSFKKIVPSKYMPEILKLLSKIFKGEKEHVYIEIEAKNKKSELIPIAITGRALWKKGRIIGVQGIARDITERKRAEEALRESEEKYKRLVELSPEAIVVHSKGKIVFINTAGAKLVGAENPEDLIGKNVLDFVHPDYLETVKERIRKLREETVEASLIEEKFIRLDGKVIDVEVTGIPFIYQGKPVVQLIARDITERKWAEEELQYTIDKLQKIIMGTIQAISLIVEIRDPYTAGHQQRVADLARSIAKEMRLSKNKIEGIHIAGLIHDIGKMNVPAEILSKPGQLTDLEFGIIKTHPKVGYDILKKVEFPWSIAQIVLQHHERINGSGYPLGLSGKKIVLEARILGVADVVEAMASYRPFRPAHGIDKALEEISQNKGILYDSKVVDACLKLFTEKMYRLPL